MTFIGAGFAPDQRRWTLDQADVDDFGLFSVSCVFDRLARGHQILVPEEWGYVNRQEMLVSRGDSLPTLMEQCPVQQEACRDRPLIDGGKSESLDLMRQPTASHPQSRMRTLSDPRSVYCLDNISSASLILSGVKQESDEGSSNTIRLRL